jgi:hypothetical protein
LLLPALAPAVSAGLRERASTRTSFREAFPRAETPDLATTLPFEACPLRCALAGDVDLPFPLAECPLRTPPFNGALWLPLPLDGLAQREPAEMREAPGRLEALDRLDVPERLDAPGRLEALRESRLGRRDDRLAGVCARLRSREWAAGRLKCGRGAEGLLIEAGLSSAETRGAGGADTSSAGAGNATGLGSGRRSGTNGVSSSKRLELKKYEDAIAELA